MDANLDYEIYSDIDSMLLFEDDQMQRRKVINCRILKLYSAKSKFSYATMGITLSHSEQLSKSIFPLKKFTTIEPGNAKVQIELAKALLKLERDNECLDSLKKALAFSPEAGPLHRILIEALEKNHRLQELEVFTKEITNMIADPAALQEFYIMNAEILIENNKYPQAIVSYKKATETNPIMEDYYHYHYNYGLALYHEGFFEEAIIQFEHAWRLNPKEKNTFNNIVHLNYCLGKVEKAIEGFEDVIKNGLEVHYTYSNYMLVLYHLNKDEEEIKKYKDLLKPFIQSHRQALLRIYQEELRITQGILQKDDIDEKTREFNTKKLKGVNQVLSFLLN